MNILSLSVATPGLAMVSAAGLALLAFRATKARAVSGEAHQHGSARDPSAPTPAAPSIPVIMADPDHAARAVTIKIIADLISENDWIGIGQKIAAWEASLESTPGGLRLYDIAVETCLTGLQALLDEARHDQITALRPAEIEAERMVARHLAYPEHPVLAAIAARAHLLIAANCHADYWPETLRHAIWRRQAQHVLAARQIVSRFDAVTYMSPLLAEAAYHVARNMPDAAERIRPAFEDWIDLDPAGAAIYAAHAPNLLPDRFGTYAEIMAEAERAEERTADTLGLGGYALFFLPLLDEDDEIRGMMDTGRFAAGLLDLARLSGTQSDVNRAAALLSDEIDASEGRRREILVSTFDALVQGHLDVIYPRLWSIPLEDIQLRLSATRSGRDKPVSRILTRSRLQTGGMQVA